MSKSSVQRAVDRAEAKMKKFLN